MAKLEQSAYLIFPAEAAAMSYKTSARASCIYMGLTSTHQGTNFLNIVNSPSYDDHSIMKSLML